MLKNEQVQEIFSPDRKLKIIHHRSYIDRFGCYCVEGAIRNISQGLNLNAEIMINYFDVDDNPVDSEVDKTVRDLAEGTTVAFHTMYSGRLRGRIKYYRIQLTEQRFSK